MNLVIPDWLALECVTLDRVLHLPAQLIDHGPHLTVTIDQVLHGLHRQARAAKPRLTGLLHRASSVLASHSIAELNWRGSAKLISRTKNAPLKTHAYLAAR